MGLIIRLLEEQNLSNVISAKGQLPCFYLFPFHCYFLTWRKSKYQEKINQEQDVIKEK